MNSLFTETTETIESGPTSVWIFYDRDCRSCSELALRFRSVFARRSFTFVPLQEPWVRTKLALSAAETLAEMRVLTPDGTVLGGADAVVLLARQVWWMSPLSWIAQLPGGRGVLQSLYRWIAARRHCAVSRLEPGSSLPRTRWLPLLVLAILALLARPFLPAWGFMWTMAIALFFGCKWLTLRTAQMRSADACPFRASTYLLAWPGMDATRFLSYRVMPGLERRVIVKSVAAAVARISLGALLLFVIARQAPEPLLAGWIGMVGMVLLLHFGLLHLASITWRGLRVDAPPVMDAPLRSTSIGEFWSRRWNGAFNQLALQLVFRPLARRTGTTMATLCAFGVSGVVHELVISLPANAGYGLPTAYFILQGIALLAEHTRAGKRFGLGRGVRGWLFTMLVVAAPAFWLFHPPFVRRVILPFMQAIGAL
ncbi:MAG TPA: DCC1-like thiol-disulfide oxidoreductase family protein [Chthoniobacteraceae bacterium]|nr:DCC1-like thiol-disulfide oxidoreductase family protein [Chthoniobacteraceae bacterium]